jgi:CTP:molybdopterin cytidylyltransferase MocA
VKLACAILAAGASRRLGQPKQLIELAGKPLIRHVVDQLTAANLGPIAVVVGSNAERTFAALSGSDVVRLDNDEWQEGIAASIRIAAAWAERERCDALLLATCDQPRLDPSHARALYERFERTGEVTASSYAAATGVPAIFPASWFARLRELKGDRGAGQFLRRDPTVQAVAWPEGAHDIDTPEDLEAFRDPSS